MRVLALMIVLAVSGMACGSRRNAPPSSVQPVTLALASEELTLLADAINHFAERWADTTSVCVTITDRDGQAIPVNESLRRMLHQRHPVAAGAACEPYGVGTRVVLSSPGAVKEATAEQRRVHRLAARRPLVGDSAQALVQLTELLGTDYGYDCVVSRLVRNSVTCRLTTVTNY